MQSKSDGLAYEKAEISIRAMSVGYEGIFEAIDETTECQCHKLSDMESLMGAPPVKGSVGIAFIEDDISSFIQNLRLHDNSLISELPVVFIGFRSWRSLILSERYPKLLSSNGVYYLRLPVDIREIKQVIETASKVTIADPQNEVRIAMDQTDLMSKEQAGILHTKGNFFGAEKLLYGAYLNKELSLTTLKDTISAARSEQKRYLAGDDETLLLNYKLHVLNQPDYDEIKDENNVMAEGLKGHILLIDDLSNLGWADAIAKTLSAGQASRVGNREAINSLFIEKFSSAGFQVEALSKDTAENVTEDSFFDSLLTKLTADYINSFDIILLDLRLKRRADEDIEDLKAASGIRVLDKICGINAGIPIIMLTASRMAKNMEMVLDHGAIGYFVKEMSIADEADAKDYFRRFYELINFALSKSYLGSG